MSSSNKSKGASAPKLGSSQPDSGEKAPSSSSKTYALAAAQVRTHVATGTSSTKTNDATLKFDTVDINDGSFIVVNSNTFEKFQSAIFPIITTIAQDETNYEHTAVLAWNEGLHHPSHRLDGDTSLRTIMKIFPKITDLQTYRKFVLSFPRIKEFIDTRSGSQPKQGFEFRIKSVDPKEVAAEAIQLPNIEPVRCSEISKVVQDPVVTSGELDVTGDSGQPLDGFLECYGTKDDFSVLMSQVWWIMHHYSATAPDDTLSKNWLEWETQGIEPNTSYQQAKVIMGLNNLYDLYCFIRDSEPCRQTLEIKWDNKILFRPNAILHSGTNTSNSSTSSMRSGSTTTLQDSDSFTLIEAEPLALPATPVRNNSLTHATGNQSNSAESLTCTVHEDHYYKEFYSIDSANIDTTNEFVVFHCFNFDIIQQWCLTNTGRTDMVITNWRRWVFNGLTRYSSFAAVKQIMRIDDLDAYLQVIQQYPPILASISWTWRDEHLRYWFMLEPTGAQATFMQHHNVDQAKLNNLRSELHMFSNTLDTSLTSLNSRLVDMHQRLDNLDTRVTAQASNLKWHGQRILDDHKITLRNLATDQATSYANGLNDIQERAAMSYQNRSQELNNTAADTIAAQVDTLQTQSVKLVDEYVTSAKQAMTNLLNEFQAAIAANAMTDSASIGKDPPQTQSPAIASLNPTTVASDDGPKDTSAVTTTRTRFPNVDPAYRHHLQTATYHNPYLTSDTDNPGVAQAEPTEHNPPSPEDAQTSRVPDLRDPTVVYPSINHTKSATGKTMGAMYSPGLAVALTEQAPLPPLLYDYIMKRATIQYAGQEDILVFYNQLKNGVGYYGLYLIEVLEFAVGKSLCPTHVQNIKITDDRYMAMAGCLYQKLVCYDTIPAEFTFARNIINRFAEVNDGYKVLYALIEPLLHRDVISNPPLEEHWSSIHEYAIKFQSYINCEAIAGRNYTQKEQANLFLNGLSSGYRPAVRRARLLLELQGPTAHTVPSVLKISALPATIDRWQVEESGTSICRAAYKSDKSTSYKPDRNGKQPGDHGHRTSLSDRSRTGGLSDQKCPICFGYGHPKYQCQPFAKYLLCREAENRLEESVKAKIVETYKATMKQKADNRRKQQQMGTVRQLWDQGRPYSEIEDSLLQTITALDDNTSGDSSESDE